MGTKGGFPRHPVLSTPHRAARRVAAAATEKPADFDALLELVADKFEKAENKPVVAGYAVGAVVRAPEATRPASRHLEGAGPLSAGQLAGLPW
jgi:hypothetical protein